MNRNPKKKTPIHIKDRSIGRNEWPPYYAMVRRVPDTKGKPAYTRLVTVAKADRLVNGAIKFDTFGNPYRQPLSRKYKRIQLPL